MAEYEVRRGDSPGHKAFMLQKHSLFKDKLRNLNSHFLPSYTVQW